MKTELLHFVNLFKLTILGILVGQTFLISCSKYGKVDYIAFQKNEGDRWGLIDWEGNILIDNEFQNMPSFVKDGVFFVLDENGLLDLYTAEKKFKKISGGYKNATLFNEGLAAVVESGQHIKYINTKGEKVFELTDYKGEHIVASSSFYDGKAIIVTEDDMYGYIDKRGEVIIPPVYENAMLFYNGYALVKKDGVFMFIDENQKEIVKFNHGVFPLAYPTEGSYPYIYKDTEKCGIRKLSGEDIIKSDKKFKYFSGFYNGCAIFENSEKDCGLIDKNGNVIIRAKYESLILCDDVIIYNDKGKVGLLSYNGDIILKARYKKILPFIEGNQYTYAKDENEFFLIDRKGKEVGIDTYHNLVRPSSNCFPSILPISLVLNSSDLEMVKSDYIDMDSEAEKILSFIKDTSVDRVPYKVYPEVFAEAYNKDYKASDLKGSTILSHTISKTDYYELTIHALYDENVIVPNYEKKWHDSYYYDGYYEDVITGYSYNSIRSNCLKLDISLKNRFEGKCNYLYDSLCKGLESKGFVKRSDDNFNNSEGNLSVNYEKQSSDLKINMIAFPDSEAIEIYIY